MPHEAIDYCRKLYISRQNNIDHFFLNIHLPNVLLKGEIWAYMKDLANYKAKHIHGLQPQLLKWVANDLCETITMLSILVAKHGFPTSWTINITQMIIKTGEIRSRGALLEKLVNMVR